jgi:hypothetical protein
VKVAITTFCLILAAAACAAQANPPEQLAKPSVQGRVLQEPDGLPVRKANVQLNGLPGPGPQGRGPAQYSAISDAEGRFTIPDIELGHYFVTVEHPGFVQSGRGNHRSSLAVQVGSGKNELILHMQPAAIITGKIVDLDGDAMGGVSVAVTRVGSRAGGLTVHSFGNAATNDLGEFRISELRAGRYNITAIPPPGARPPELKESNGKDQPIYLPTHYPGVLNEEHAVLVEIHAGAETRVNFGLLTGRAYHVSGSITGIPSKSGMAQVILEGQRGEMSSQPGQQELGEGGRFEFKNVLPGTYVARLIIFTFDGGKPAAQMLRLGEPIEVRNASLEGLLLQPEVGGQVRGKFRLDAEQKFDWTQLNVMLVPVEEGGARVVWMGGEGSPTSSNVSADGGFELKNVPGGTYQLVVGANSDNLADYFTKSVELGGREVTDSGFAVSAETYLEVVVSARGASISGRVVDTKGQPIANATVVDIPSPEHRGRLDLYQRGTTDASGNFILHGLSAGKYSVLAFEELQEDVRQPEFLKLYEKRGETIELEEGARKSVVLKVIPDDAETQSE